jgi:UDP-glucuronate 4-epimerase
MTRIYVTGAAGFIGYHLCDLLLSQGATVHGFDGMTPYYDPALKEARLALLTGRPGFSFTRGMLEDTDLVLTDIRAFAPDIIVHLAAQAGVRYSLEAPRSYISANIDGLFNVLEAAREVKPRHLMLASTSSVYGANRDMPYRETDKADAQVSLYAATKKAGEAISHAWADLYGLPTTCFRFFTVYGPWGRPDMAPHLFTSAILEGRPIQLFGGGEMFRDFTYVTDLVRGIAALVPVAPERGQPAPDDSLSPVAPWRVVNIGNGEKVALARFIEAIERATGTQAIRKLREMQKGDVRATWADTGLLGRLTGFRPETGIDEGIERFVAWYRDYYRI